jgi:hypothetical protein
LLLPVFEHSYSLPYGVLAGGFSSFAVLPPRGKKFFGSIMNGMPEGMPWYESPPI